MRERQRAARERHGTEHQEKEEEISRVYFSIFRTDNDLAGFCPRVSSNFKPSRGPFRLVSCIEGLDIKVGQGDSEMEYNQSGEEGETEIDV